MGLSRGDKKYSFLDLIIGGGGDARIEKIIFEETSNNEKKIYEGVKGVIGHKENYLLPGQCCHTIFTTHYRKQTL